MNLLQLDGVKKQIVMGADALKIRHGESTAIGLQDGGLLLMWTELFRKGYDPMDGRVDSDQRGRGGDDNYGRISAMISDDGGESWTAPWVAVDDKDALINCMSPGLARLPDGRLMVAYSWRNGGNPVPGREIRSGEAAKRVRFSSDDGRNWSEARRITPADGHYHTGCHDRTYTLPSGRILVQIHSRFEQEGPPHLWRRMTNWVAYSDDQGQTWQPSGRLDEPRSPKGFAEASIARRTDGSLLMVMRTTLGQSYFTESGDEGATWSRPTPSGFAVPAAPSLLTAIPGTDDFLLFWNPLQPATGAKRSPLLYALSRDGGRTWGSPSAIETAEDCSWDYPSLLFHEGQAHLFYRRGYQHEEGGQVTHRHDLVHARIPVSWFYEKADASSFIAEHGMSQSWKGG